MSSNWKYFRGVPFSVLIISSFLSVNVIAESNDCYVTDGMEESRNYLSSSFQWENDIGNSDRWYTNGMKYSRTKSQCADSDIFDKTALKLLQTNINQDIFLTSWVGGMNMYTPQNISIPTHQPNDRPWTGWAYFGREWKRTHIENVDPNGSTSYTPGDSDQVQLLVGVLGSWAHQDSVQRTWHTLVGARDPKGWANQDSGKLGVSAAYTREWQASFQPADVKGRLGVTVGNVVNQGVAGGSISLTSNKFEIEDPTYLPIVAFASNKQISPAYNFIANEASNDHPEENSQINLLSKLSNARKRWYQHSHSQFFLDVEARYIASSTFISGTNVTIKPLVVDKKLGVAHKCANSDWTWRLSYLIRSPEFTYPAGGDAPVQKVWQLSFEWDWGWVRNPYIAPNS
ncbi:MAG: lipid A deacylase LpxR family protein [Sideroxydans sp.]|nr:lipid A deacylase LpxR family protein [Sideroxydans sp.]